MNLSGCLIWCEAVLLFTVYSRTPPCTSFCSVTLSQNHFQSLPHSVPPISWLHPCVIHMLYFYLSKIRKHFLMESWKKIWGSGELGEG